MDDKVYLLPLFFHSGCICLCGVFFLPSLLTYRKGLLNFYDTTGVDNGVAEYIQRCESLSGQFYNPVADFVMPSRDQVSFFSS